MENSHGNCEKPPRSFTMEGTAVARMVESIATRPVVSMSAMRIGPRSERKPTLVSWGEVTVSLTVVGLRYSPPPPSSHGEGRESSNAREVSGADGQVHLHGAAAGLVAGDEDSRHRRLGERVEHQPALRSAFAAERIRELGALRPGLLRKHPLEYLEPAVGEVHGDAVVDVFDAGDLRTVAPAEVVDPVRKEPAHVPQPCVVADAEHTHVPRFVAVTEGAVDDLGAPQCVHAGNLRGDELHSLGEHDGAGGLAAADAEGGVRGVTACRVIGDPLDAVDGVAQQREGRVLAQLLECSCVESGWRLAVMQEDAARVRGAQVVLLAGVDEQNRAAAPNENHGGGEPGGSPAHDDGVVISHGYSVVGDRPNSKCCCYSGKRCEEAVVRSWNAHSGNMPLPSMVPSSSAI